MADDKSRNPITPDSVDDPSDAFARADPNAGVDPNDLKEQSKRDRKKRRAERGDAPREPRVESKPKESKEDDDGMDPFDAAAEVIALADGLFAAACAIRSYDKLVMPDGRPMLQLVMADDASKLRLQKALARVMKSAGASMSPGAALALAAFGCYGAPILGMELARATAKKAPA